MTEQKRQQLIKFILVAEGLAKVYNTASASYTYYKGDEVGVVHNDQHKVLSKEEFYGYVKQSFGIDNDELESVISLVKSDQASAPTRLFA